MTAIAVPGIWTPELWTPGKGWLPSVRLKRFDRTVWRRAKEDAIVQAAGLVASTSNGSGSITSPQNLTIAAPSSTSQLVVWAFVNTVNATPISINSLSGQVWSNIVQEHNNSSASVSCWVSTNPGTGTTVSIVPPVTAVAWAMVCFEFSGITGVIDAAALNAFSSTSVASKGTSTYTPTQEDLLLAFAATTNGTLPTIGTSSTGWTAGPVVSAGTARRVATWWKDDSAAQAFTATFTPSAACTVDFVGVKVSLGATKTLDASVAGAAAVAAQADATRGLEAAPLGNATISVPVALTRDMPAAVAGAGTVTPAIGATRAIDASVAGAGAVSATVGRVISVAAAMSGASTIAVQEIPLRGLAAAVVGAGAVTVDAVRTLGLAASPAGAGSVSFNLAATRALAAAISATGVVSAGVSPIRGIAINVTGAGTLVVDLTSGGLKTFDVGVTGAGAVIAALSPTRGLAAALSGATAVTVQDVVTRALAAAIAGVSTVTIPNIGPVKLIWFPAGADDVLTMLTAGADNLLTLSVAGTDDLITLAPAGTDDNPIATWTTRSSPPFGSFSVASSNQLTLTAGAGFATPKVGDVVVIPFVHRAGAATSATDTRGNVWSIAQTQNAAGTLFLGFVYCILQNAFLASGDTLVINFAASGHVRSGNTHVVAGKGFVAPRFDTQVVGADVAAGTTIPIGNPSTLDNELIIDLAAWIPPPGTVTTVWSGTSTGSSAGTAFSITDDAQGIGMQSFARKGAALGSSASVTTTTPVVAKGISIAFLPGTLTTVFNPAGSDDTITLTVGAKDLG